jgi:hypothetical protein
VSKRGAGLVAANAAVVAALVVWTLMVHHRRDTILYGDVFALLALALTDVLLVKVSDGGGDA